VSVGAKAPALQAVDLKGKKVRLSDLKGQVVVLEFWAPTNPAYGVVAEDRRELAKEMKGRPLAMVSVSADGSKEAARKFIDKVPKPWAQWWVGRRAKQLETWNVHILPTTYVIDHKGVIRCAQTLFDNQAFLREEVQKQVEAAEAEKKPGGG
jgi:peroxiredoxin